MKRLIALGMVIGALALGAKAFAAEGGILQDRKLQALFEWSAQAVQTVRGESQTAGPAARSREIPSFMEYRGSGIR